MENNQREITHKILKPELWFLCMTHRLIMLNKCTKFYCKNDKRFSSYSADMKLYRKKSKGNNSKNTQARVMVLVHDTSSHRGLQVYQVSLKIF